MSWRALMSFLDTTAVKHFGTLMSYDVMIPAMYVYRPTAAHRSQKYCVSLCTWVRILYLHRTI